MTDELHDKKFTISLGQKVVSEARKTAPLGDVLLVNDPGVPADAAFYEWVRKTIREDKADMMPLCAGARIVVDENGEGTLTIDESLPDGVWLVTQGGKTMRCEGVHGPIRAESKAEKAEDIEVSPVALTFETRKP